jgi:Queuosine biosynthesis protein QueC
MTNQLPNVLPDNIEGDIGVLWSSGMESTLLILMCIEKYGKDRVQAFTQKFPSNDPYELGQRHYHYFSRIIADELDFTNHHVIEIHSGGLYSNEVRQELYHAALAAVPTLGIVIAGINSTHFGPLSVQSNKDVFVSSFEHLPLIYAPFINMTKDETVKMFYEKGLEQWLPYTRSCAKDTPLHCGTCLNCSERKRGFKLAGYADPTDYIID